MDGRDSTTDYVMFNSVIQYAMSFNQLTSYPMPLGFCDNRYANGGDILFKDYMAA
jgi:hypothetical protein